MSSGGLVSRRASELCGSSDSAGMSPERVAVNRAAAQFEQVESQVRGAARHLSALRVPHAEV